MRRSALSLSARCLAVLLLGLTVGGCDEGVEGFVDMVLSGTGFEKVNVANGTDRTVAGTVALTDPSGREVLADSFRLEPDEDGGGVQVNLTVDDVPALATYDAAFRAAGRYSVSLELDEPIDGSQTVEETVEITAPEQQRVLVVLGTDEEGPVQVTRLPNPDEQG